MTGLPTGTVTFLFTDIEGSTKRWEAHPQQMRAALARHDEILRSAIEEHGGYVFKTVGDAFYAAFPTASQALQSVLDAQHALNREEWPAEIGIVQVRMALHVGAAEERDGDYFGQPLNRVARLLSAGHGGQTLLSNPTYDLVRDALPAGVQILDLGAHSLKDLNRPENIFQLVIPDLPSEFPPLRTLDNRPNNLPRQSTAFVGRAKEQEAVGALLRRLDTTLLTLTGPGGTGKTRLGLQVAADLLDDFSDGVWFVELAPLVGAGLVVPTIAEVLGVKESAGQPLIETLKAYLKEKQLLLVLDNFEQVGVAAGEVSQLLAASGELKALATSRVSLRIKGEKEFAVSTLELPDIKHLPPLERLTQFEAVRLFIERAADAKADFQVTNENAPLVVEICTRLDGLPLAIELAAARIKMLPLHSLVTRLSQRLKLLTGGARDLTARQQTLRGAIDWSYDLLDEGHKQLFRRMAPFVGGRTLEALEAVCNYDGGLQVDVFDGAETLLSNNLVQQREGSDGEPRFWMLETIHEYAREKLAESGEAEALRKEHALYFMKLAEEAEPYLIGPEQQEWLNRLEGEHDNLRAALIGSFRNGEGGVQSTETEYGQGVGLRLAGALMWFWYFRGYLREGRSWLESALAAVEAGAGTVGDEGRSVSVAPESALAKALSALGIVAFLQTDYEAASAYLTRGMRLWREVGDKRGIAFTGIFLGRMAARQGDPTGWTLSEESVALFREIGDKWGLALSLDFLGQGVRDRGDEQGASALQSESRALYQAVGHSWGVAQELGNAGQAALRQGDYHEARARLEEALAILQGVGDTRAIAWTLHALGDLAREEADLERALMLYIESLGMFRDQGDKEGIASSLGNLGIVAYEQGDDPAARSLYEQSLTIMWEIGVKTGVAMSLAGLGEVATQTGQPRKGAGLLAASQALLEAIGAVMLRQDLSRYDRAVASARSQLGEEAFDKARQEGHAMSIEEAIEYALEES